MKILSGTPGSMSNLVFATCVTIALTNFGSGAAVTKIVNETFDPPKLYPLFGFEDKATDIIREYVTEGVGGSTAIHTSATLPEDEWAQVATILRQGGTIEGNNLATRENSVLSLDIKVDRPDLDEVRIMIESWAGYWWSADYTVSVGQIPLGNPTPGTFKNIVVPLDDPLWVQNPWPDPENMPPLFDPSGKTYQIWLIVNTDILPAGGHFTVTVDNVKILTKSAMIPWEGTGTGEITWLLPAPDYVPYRMDSIGVATHVGAFEDRTQWTVPNPAADIVLTAANGDKLFGYLRVTSLYDSGVEIYDGTGRFKGAVGGWNISAEWDESLSFYSVTSEGCIATVGSKK